MKNALKFCLGLSAVLMLAGCGKGKEEFNPTESTVYVTSKGVVHSAVMESFEEAYYNFDELEDEIEGAVESYCLTVGSEEVVTLESLKEKDGTVTLKMDYASVADYAEFNDVVFFSGTLSEAIASGYRPGQLYDKDGNAVSVEKEQQEKLKVIVTEENICVQTDGAIKYVTDNVTIIGKKQAKAVEAGNKHLAFVIYE